ncbi:MAG: hypothetical protein EOO23_03380 [Comamonadaceae bacterium]|nr:MAG: hypothetical protein EOO23_03380 [Comamonadaceae bacterium]
MAQSSLKQPNVVEPVKELSSDLLWAPVSSRVLAYGDRRLEASAFLRDGFGLRQGLEAIGSTVPFAELSNVWMPGRLKGYTVDEGRGLPYLSAGQVFESKPRVRKWLAKAMVKSPDTLRVDPHWLLLSRSGEVGRLTAVYREHADKIISDDMLRVVPQDPDDYGWLYAYMKTPTFFAIARSAQYGHMIKHLEPEHVLGMPVAMPDPGTRRRIGSDAKRALEERQAARDLQVQADDLYATAINRVGAPVGNNSFSTVSASSVSAGRRRMEGQFHSARVLQIEDMIDSSGRRVQPLADLVESVTVGARFKRYFGDNGTPYRSASELFDVNPPVTKRIYSALLPDPEKYMLRAGWIIMACSGQTYGLLGRTMVLTENHDGIFGSHDLIRIIPDQARARAGYLQTVLNHVDYGRPRVVRHASGTSVPHLDPQDIREVLIPRLSPSEEDAIADLSDEATRLSGAADRLETAAVKAAEQAISVLTARRGGLRLTQGG